MKALFAGRWRIVEMEQWDQEFVDLVSPGQITFTREGRGELHFGAVDLSLDWRADATGNRVVFAFAGSDEGDEVTVRMLKWVHGLSAIMRPAAVAHARHDHSGNHRLGE